MIFVDLAGPWPYTVKYHVFFEIAVQHNQRRIELSYLITYAVKYHVFF